MPRHKRTERGELARQRILIAAESLFAAHGFHGASVRDIGRAARMPTASLLHHFPTKAKLYGAVLALIAANLEEALSAALSRDGDDRERLRRLCRDTLQWSTLHPARSNLLLRELLDNPARVREAHTLHLAPLVARIGDFVHGGQRRGAFRRVHPTLFLVQLVGTASYWCVAMPTLDRIANATSATLKKTSRSQLVAMLARGLETQAKDAA